jgi:hypothetical protein
MIIFGSRLIRGFLRLFRVRPPPAGPPATSQRSHPALASVRLTVPPLRSPPAAIGGSGMLLAAEWRCRSRTGFDAPPPHLARAGPLSPERAARTWLPPALDGEALRHLRSRNSAVLEVAAAPLASSNTVAPRRQIFREPIDLRSYVWWRVVFPSWLDCWSSGV